MSQQKTELAVAALQHGTVIDHIPSAAVFQVVKILGLEHTDHAVTIGANLASAKLGSKGIVKVADMFFDEAALNRIALIAPSAVVNIIRNYEVVEKRPVALPDTIVGIVKCNNPKCITNNEPMRTYFNVIDKDNVTLKCRYCERMIEKEDIELK